MILDPELTYLQLGPDGSATPLAGGPAFWSLPDAELERRHAQWLVSEFVCRADWPNWEMHPDGDELVYLLSGAVTLLLDRADGVQRLALQGRAALHVPRGVWHTADVAEPSRLLHLTWGRGTRHRPR